MPRPPPPGRGAPGARRPMRDFFGAWLATLRSPLLPLLRRALSSSSGSWNDPISSAAAAVEAHFQAHWSALDAAARQDPAQAICAGDWRSPLELPFLWLGDLHPSLLTSLLRSLSPSPRLLTAADRVDRRIRAAVPAVSDRLRHAQEAFTSAEVAGAADLEAFLEELKAVALEANRLRRGVLSELVAAAGGHQAALFLEALSRFVLSMHDPEVLRRFDHCRPSPGAVPLSSIRVTVINLPVIFLWAIESIVLLQSCISYWRKLFNGLFVPNCINLYLNACGLSEVHSSKFLSCCWAGTNIYDYSNAREANWIDYHLDLEKV